MCARLTEAQDEQIWELGGRDVTLLLIDRGGFRFHCWTLDGDLEVRFGTPFLFRLADGREVEIDPEQPQAIAPLLDLIRTAVSQIAVRRAGELTVTFSDASSIRSRPHPAYEAWEINGAGELREIGYLCGPGGGSPWG